MKRFFLWSSIFILFAWWLYEWQHASFSFVRSVVFILVYVAIVGIYYLLEELTRTEKKLDETQEGLGKLWHEHNKFKSDLKFKLKYLENRLPKSIPCEVCGKPNPLYYENMICLDCEFEQQEEKIAHNISKIFKKENNE